MIAAVVSTFHPGGDIAKNIEAIASQVDMVWVVDDSGRAPSDVLPYKPPGWYSEVPANSVVLVNESNSGIAAALNRGITAALDAGSDLILTLDQDTHVPSMFVNSLVSALAAAQAEDASICGAAPSTVNANTYELRHPVGPGHCSVEVIQSGLLLGAAAFREVGFFRPELFIDGVEADFMMRLHHQNRHVLLVEGLDLSHPLGSPRTVTLLGHVITTSNHAAFRRYYITRNRLSLIRRYRKDDPAWAKLVGVRLVKQSVYAVTVEPDRFRKGIAMARGVIHSLVGRTGQA